MLSEEQILLNVNHKINMSRLLEKEKLVKIT